MPSKQCAIFLACRNGRGTKRAIASRYTVRNAAVMRKV
jgi:hypothetical protein